MAPAEGIIPSVTKGETVKDDWSGRRVTVMGLGLFGGGVAAAQYFADRGAAVLVTDKRRREELGESVAQVEGVNVTLRLGGHDVRDFTRTDLVIANPAVPLDNEYLEAARAAGVRIDAEMNLVFRKCPAPIVGVTGSNGKSTTAALIAHILKTAGRTCHLGGNIGRPLLGELESIAPDHLVVLEVSSFQLEYLHLDRLSPYVAVVMNLQPNHLDRHGTMENYAAVKRHIVEHQKAGDVAVLNADDPWTRAMAEATAAGKLFFSMRGPVQEGAWVDADAVRFTSGGRETVVRGLDRMKLIGLHNRENACAAVAVACALGAGPEAAEEALASFEPLPHRLQTVAERDGVTYINDSIATNPSSVKSALACFDGNVILIAGGSPKHIPYGPMVESVIEKVKLLLLIGRTAEDIGAAVRAVSPDRPEIAHAGTLERAVRLARERSAAGDIVLLSPACASFDQFSNFAERGNRFAELVTDASS